MRYLSIIFIVCSGELIAQSFAPAPNEFGSNAIYKDSSIFVSWASAIDLRRGYLNIADKNLGLVSYGTPEKALLKAEGNSMDVVSLGDSGVAILTFEYPIFNGEGFDFAVFENAFADHLMELAFVEVSSDGVYYARFPSISEIPLSPQLTGFEYSNCGYVNNLAGKFRQGYGTPFELSEIIDSQVDINNITHIKLIDVIGSTDLNIGNFDSQNQLINDPYPTSFESGGFDLDGVGVIHSKNVSQLNQVKNQKNTISVFENKLHVFHLDKTSNYQLIDVRGKTLQIGVISSSESIDLLSLGHGIYFLKINQQAPFKFYK